MHFEKKLRTQSGRDVWQEYCGLGQRFLKGQVPQNADEFRRLVPLTTYEDYADILLLKQSDMLPAPPVVWLQTTWESGNKPEKWAPYSEDMLKIYKTNIIAAMILSTSDEKGKFHVRSNYKVLYGLAPMPYATGLFPDLIDSEIKKAILVGDCEDRAEFAQYYAQRGKQTGSFGLTPGMKHYACAVCVDAQGEYASAVGMSEFDAPAEGATDASVTASFTKWFDGDALAKADPDMYGDYAGWAVMNISFQLGGSAKEALYTIYPVSILEEEGATNEDVKELLLSNDLLGIYNFYTESQVTVQLEWDCDYKLFAIAFDQNKNAGEMFTLEIPALSKAGASPADQF